MAIPAAWWTSGCCKSYVAVGPLAHFQAGTSVSLPHDMEFEADAYEELPLATDVVYSTTGKGKKKVTTSTNEDPAEDNGFITSLDIPLTRHVTLSGFYRPQPARPRRRWRLLVYVSAEGAAAAARRAAPSGKLAPSPCPRRR
jgi:hypothetical protein